MKEQCFLEADDFCKKFYRGTSVQYVAHMYNIIYIRIIFCTNVQHNKRFIGEGSRHEHDHDWFSKGGPWTWSGIKGGS